VFESVDIGLFHFGIMAVESTVGGTVPDVNEFLTEGNLQIVGEVKTPIHYCVMTLPETDPREIRVAYSIPQALSLCQKYLSLRKIEGRPYYDAGAAARMLMRERPEASAVIAPRYAAEFYNLVCVEESVGEGKGDFTRYLVLAREGDQSKGTKCSVVFSTDHRAGALFEILREFADIGINLTKIESVPSRHDSGAYAFFLDFDGSTADPRVAAVIEKVRSTTQMFKFLGCYPAA
jgi:prephenate dehydratase